MKKVVYISYMHLSEKVARDWYIDYLRANGIMVEYWDLIPLLFGRFNEAGSKIADFVFTPGTYSELEKMLGLPENREAIYVILICYEGRFARLFRLLSKYNCRTYFIAWGNIPVKSLPIWHQIVCGLINNPRQFTGKVINKIKGVVYKELKLVNSFDVVFAAGDATVKMYPDAGKIVPINLVDYDHYMRTKSASRRIVEGPYAVFLDIYLPYQSDLKAVGLQVVDPQNYFFSLNRFFKIFEQEYGIKVVIAAHPKADYGNKTFEGREIYMGLTPELVKDADFVISHHSTSLGYAVLNCKPIIFVYTDEMKRLYKETSVSFMHDIANYLGANIYNIDQLTQGDQIAISGVNFVRYEKYKYGYLTTRETEHTTTQELFLREIMY